MTTDLAKARERLESWTTCQGSEDLVIKPLNSRYLTRYVVIVAALVSGPAATRRRAGSSA